ncbi:MAG: hypothetical protein LBG50_02430 [Clostridiales Family XIII bacterium]|jgi:predicted transcriptional regulator|nr:hypothetical protein [Clostridiales Family XIII bacterium]
MSLTTADIGKTLTPLNREELPAREITSVYCGDLLSHVMGTAPESSAWVTVMNNVNVIAVASLADVACVVMAAGSQPSEDVIARADEQGVPLFSSDGQIFDTACGIHEKLQL